MISILPRLATKGAGGLERLIRVGGGSLGVPAQGQWRLVWTR